MQLSCTADGQGQHKRTGKHSASLFHQNGTDTDGRSWTIMESTDFVYSALCPVWQYQAKENSHSDTHTHHILHYDKQSHMF